MAKLKHPATLIQNGRVIARGVSFAAALKLAGATDIKGAARRRVNFYKGTPYYFNSYKAAFPMHFVIVPTVDLTLVMQFGGYKDCTKKITTYELLEKLWAGNIIKGTKFPGRDIMNRTAVYLLSGNIEGAQWSSSSEYFLRGDFAYYLNNVVRIYHTAA